MLFNSIQFVLFFPLVCLFYFLLPVRFRWMLLLLASAYFYAQFVIYYLFVLSALIALDFWLAIQMEKTESRVAKGWILAFSVSSNLAFLFVFKYYNFFLENLSWLLPSASSIPHLDLILPIGLSFHVFQSIGYMVEVFSGRVKAERHLGFYALFVLFFPQLVAGPIESPQNLLPQLKAEHRWNAQGAISGFQLIISGFLLKLLVADRLSPLVSGFYENAPTSSGPLLLLATYFFTFQIYCDFAGYSAIAKGTAKILGVNLQKNFRSPFLSHSIPEFWGRWHISLGAWFRNYLYLPLGGNRRGALVFVRNILLVFFLSGLWHGAKWGYVVFGVLHGIFYLAYMFLPKRIADIGNLFPKKAVTLTAQLVVFHLVAFAFIFFRAKDLPSAAEIIRRIFSWSPGTYAKFSVLNLWFGIFLCLFLLLYEARKEAKQRDFWAEIDSRPLWVKGMAWQCIFILFLGIFLLGENSPQPFIYFQF